MPRRLPVLGQSEPDREPSAEADPLALLRGGRFARWFAVMVAVVGLVWIAAHKVNARTDDPKHDTHVLVHGDLTDDPRAQVLLARVGPPPGGDDVPPMPTVEDITPDRGDEDVPPMPPVEDITPDRGGDGAPPMPPVEDITPDRDGEVTDRFGRTRTNEGALVLQEEGDEGGSERGIDQAAKDKLAAGGFFDPERFDDVETVKTKAYVHLMPGIPNEVFFGSSVLILLLSFAGLERFGGARGSRRYWRLELTRWGPLQRAIKSRWFQPAFQLPVVIAFVTLIVIGLVGSQDPGRNIAPVLTWNIWWIGLIFLVLFAGNLWCFMCPWTAIPDWFSRMSLTKVSTIRTLGKRWPKARLMMWPAIVLFAGATWLEIAFDAANRPWLTSALGIFMVVLSWGLLAVYERKAMCRYVCFVGRVSGQYSLMGMLELRRRDPDKCRTGCTTRDCFHGREGHGLPCPTHEYMGAMNENQFCTLCTECVKSCPHDNIALNVRSSGADVMHPHRSKTDEAYLAILVFIVSAFHGAAMVPLWMEWEGALRGWIVDTQTEWFGADVLGFAGSSGGTLTFTLMMTACIVVPGVLYWLLCRAMRWASARKDVPTRVLFVRFAYSLLPIALFYHLAHNATHVFYEWSKLRRLISDPLGWDHDWFGTAKAPLSALWSPESIWYLQVGLVIIGHIYGIVVAKREADRVYRNDRKAALRSHIVMLVGMIAMSLLSLWLLAQPMFMRTADI